MTREAVIKVVQRAISDGAFRTQLTRDAATALRGFDLTPAEVAAIRSGDSGRISSLGVDLRMSKAFTLAATDGRADSILTTGTDSSLASGVNSTLTSGVDSSGASTVNSSLTSGVDSAVQSGTDMARTAGTDFSLNSARNSTLNAGTDSSLASGVNSSMTAGTDSSVQSVEEIDAGALGAAVKTTGENAGHQVVQWDGNDDAPLSTVIPGEPAHAFGAETPQGGAFGDSAITADEYLPSVGYAANAGDSTGGTSSPSEPGDDPNITP